MNLLAAITTHAGYNQWINDRLYEACEKLSNDERNQDQAAFFGSISGTLNHLVAGDSIWLARFLSANIRANELLAQDALKWLPAPHALDEILFAEWAELQAMRDRIDKFVVEWCSCLHSEDLDYLLAYQNTMGRPFKRELGLLLTHFFNHQTHHRGQVTTLLFQHGVDPGITDLLAVLPNHD